MASIDNLNFEVILKDDNFNERIKNDIAAANALNIKLSELLEMKSKISRAGSSTKDIVEQAKAQEKITRETQKTAAAQAVLNEKVAREGNKTREQAAIGQERLTREIIKTATAQQRLNNATKEHSKMLGELKTLMASYWSIRGAGTLLSSLTRITGEFELQRTTLRSIIGDLDKADKIMSQIKELAVVSPFEFKDLAAYSKQLSAYSFAADEIFETTKMLADVSAGLGVGMDRIILAYGQVKSAAFLRGTEVRQFTEAGIPILDELARQFTEIEGRAVSAGEVFDKISKRLVPFEMVAKSFQEMTSEGGKFFNMQEVQAETLTGKISNLKDAYEIMLSEIGDAHSSALKGGVDTVRSLMENWERVGTVIISLISGFGAYKAVLAGVWAMEKIMASASLLERYNTLIARMQSITGNARKLSVALRVLGTSNKAAIAGIAGIVATLGIAIFQAFRNATALNRELKSIMNEGAGRSDKLVSGLNALVDKLSNAQQGSQNYRDAISELNRKYGEYLPNLLTEKNTLEEIKAAADNAAEAIRNKAKATAFEKGSEAIDEKYSKRLLSSFDLLKRQMLAFDPKLGSKAASDFIKHFRTAIETDIDGKSPYVIFRDLYDTYFGDGAFAKQTQSFTGEDMFNMIDNLSHFAISYADVVNTIAEKRRELQDNINNLYTGPEYNSFAELKGVERITADYKQWEQEIRNARLAQDEFNEAMKRLEVRKLEKLVSLYGELGRQDMVERYTKDIERLTKLQSGWKGSVNEFLTSAGLGKEKSYGLWTDDFTQSADYIDTISKRYKEILDDTKKISAFDAAGAEALKKEKETIEGIAKLLDYDLSSVDKTPTKKNKQTADEAIKARVRALKRNADEIKEAMEAYRDLMKDGFFTDDMAREFLGKIYGDATAFKKGIETWSSALEDSLKKSEGLRTEAYQDTGGVWTIGYGHTEGVKKGDVITTEQAEQMLKQDLAVRAEQLNKAIMEAGLELTQNQYDALLDFTYNAGIGSLRKLIKDRSIDEIGEALLSSNTKDRSGQEQTGLIKRRAEEYMLFMSDFAMELDKDGKLMTDFENQIEPILKALRSLGAEGVKAAEQIETAFGKLTRKGQIEEFTEKTEKAYKSLQKYYEKMSEWTGKDFNIEGTGISFDISKIVSDMNSKFDDIERRAEKMRNMLKEAVSVDGDADALASIKTKFESEFGTGIWDNFWAEYVKDGIKAIGKVSNAEKDYERKKAQEKISDLAKGYVSQKVKDSGIDMNEWSNKTLVQIIKIKKALDDLSKQDIDISDELKEALDEAGLSIEDLMGSIDKDFSSVNDNVKDELGKKMVNYAGKAAEALSYVGEKMQELAEATGNIQLSETAGQISALAQNLSAAAQGAASGGWIGAIVGGVMNIIEQSINSYITSAAELEELRQNTQAFRHELEMMSLTVDEDKFDGIFGEDKIGKALDGLEKSKLAMEKYQETMDELNKNEVTTLYEDPFEFASLGAAIFAPIFGMPGIQKNISNELKGALEAYEKGYSQLEAMQVKTKDRSGWANFWGLKDEYTSLKDLAPELWDEDGVFNVENARVFLETNTQINQQQREQIQNIVDLKDAYDAANKVVEDYLNDLYGTWGDDLSAAIYDSVISGTDAFDVLNDKAVDVIKNISQQMMYSLFFKDVMESYTDKLKESIGDTDKMISVTGEMVDELAEIFPEAARWMESVVRKAEEAGIDMTGASSSLSDGIKSITENTADLLASYINAIRADVSFSKSLWIEMNTNIRAITSAMRPLPTIVDYLAQIQAHTYNISQSTGWILNELRNVVSNEAGGSIRVVMS